jgi:hypothetical protein
MKFFQQATSGSLIINNGSLWHLEIPPGKPSRYRLAQLDDYSKLQRGNFLWKPPTTLNLRARVSSQNIPGTWGFGFWNDPFIFLTGPGGMIRPFPVFPNAAWYFFASPDNYLSFRSDKPSSGFLAATFSSPRGSPFIQVPQLALIPMLIFRSWSRKMRSKLNEIIQEDSAKLDLDVTQWNDYSLLWKPDSVEYFLNGKNVFSTDISPLGPLGLVIWLDNQFAVFNPSGEIKTGVLTSSTPAWMEINDLEIKQF